MELPTPRVRGLSARARRAVAVSAVLALALLYGSLSRLIWVVAVGWLMCVCALPICDFFEKRIPRATASLLALLTFAVFLALVLSLLVPRIIQQVTQIITLAPSLIRRAEAWLDALRKTPLAQKLNIGAGASGDFLQNVGQAVASGLPAVLAAIGKSADAVSRFFLSPVLAYYFLRNRDEFAYRLSLLLPASKRRKWLCALHAMKREISGYVRGQLLVGASVAILTAAGLAILGVPAWLVLGLLMGIFELIPYIGPLLGGIPIVLFSLPMGLYAALWAVGIVVAVQQLEGMVLSPHLMAGAIGLHPVYVLLLITAGGMLLGLRGMLLALPLFVCARGAAHALMYAEYEPV